MVSFTVQERVPELGVRLAFGATPHRIVRLVMRDAGTVVAIGAVIGCISALMLSRFLSSMLFATATTDPLTYVAVVLVLLASAALRAICRLAVRAGWTRSLRCVSVDPPRATDPLRSRESIAGRASRDVWSAIGIVFRRTSPDVASP